MIPESCLSQHIAIVGKTGSGKTYTAKGIVEQLIDAGRRVCIIDPGGDWWGLRASADGKGPGLPVAVLGGRHADVEIAPDAGADVAAFIAGENLPCVVDVSEWYKTDQIRFMVGFAQTIYKENQTALHLVIDEADQFSPQNPMAETKKLLNRMEIIVRLGRKRGFRVMMITQRPAILHKNVLTQANTLIAMQMVAPQDKKAIQDWIADNASKDDAKEVMRSLAKLETGQGWVWAPAEDHLELTQFGANRTFDAGRTPEHDDEIIEPTNLADVDLEALSARFVAAQAKDAPEPGASVDNEALNRLQRDLDAARKHAADLTVTIHRSERANNQLRAALQEIASKAADALQIELPELTIESAPTPKQTLPRVMRQTNGTAIDVNLPKGEVAVLSACIQYPDGLKREQLTVLTGYKRATRDAYIRRLRERGLVDTSDGLIVATNDGRLALPDAEPLPTGYELQQWHESRLPEGERAVLRVLIDRYPSDVERNHISDVTGYKRSTRDAYIRRLKAKQLVVTGNGPVRASETLF